MPKAKLITTLEGNKGDSEFVVAFLSETKLLTSCSIGLVSIWNLRTRQLEHRFRVGSRFRGGGTLSAIAVAPNRRRLATTFHEKIQLWSLPTGALIDTFRMRSSTASKLAWCSKGQLVGVGTCDESLQILDSRNGAFKLCGGNQGIINALHFVPRKQLLLASGTDPTIRLWDTRTGDSCGEFLGHRSDVLSVSVSPDGKILVSCSEDGTIIVWDIIRRKRMRTLRPSMTCCSVKFSLDGNSFISGDLYEGKIRVWDMNSFHSNTIAVEEGNSVDLIYSPSGQLLATSSGAINGHIHIWKFN